MNARPQIDAIIFDIGNVLLGYSFKITDLAISKLTGLSVEEVIKTVFTSHEAREVWHKTQIGETNLEEFYTEIIGLLGVSKKDISLEDLKKALNSSGCENTEIWELIETFAEVNPKIKRAIISNNTPIYTEGGEKLMPRLRDFFSPEDIIMSYEVGMMKPNPTIFTTTCEKLGVKIANTVLIDDNVENIEQFRKIGGIAIQYDCSKHYIVHLWTELGNLGLL